MVIYVLERFLARLEVSGYADQFVLKGGMHVEKVARLGTGDSSAALAGVA
jgi:hypothetical protein